MYIGADYYPEHWPEKRWEKDAKLMQAAGFNVVRLAEFAWSKMEPIEGEYDFAWLDKAVCVLGKHGIKSILGTPTGSMPAWVANKYPEAVAVQMNGERIGYGARKDNCFTSGAFRLLSERITRAMAKQYGKNPNVIGWQTDNELSGPVCYCGTCRRAFQDWLRKKYGTTDALNKAWGTCFWGHEYTTWGDIPLPMRPDANNPSLELDHRRFHSDLNVEFQHDQVVIMREFCKGQFITHNFMGFHPVLNYFDLAKDLDFAAWDNYPVWGKPEIPYQSAAAADLMRGLKRKNFWVMEQTSGPGGWGTMGRNTRPGEIRKLFFQQVAHGADGFLWFRWRVCRFGREQYWHGILGHDGVAARRYRECARTAKDCRKIEKDLAGTGYKSDVAIIRDYESAWALEIQPSFSADMSGFTEKRGRSANNLVSQIMRYHGAFTRAGVNVDVISPNDDFRGYKVLVAPEQFVLSDCLARRLADYARNGGVLLADIRAAVKDENNVCHERVLPGYLRETLKIRIEEYETLAESAVISGSEEMPGEYHAGIGCEWVIPEGARVLAGYSTDYLADYAAVTFAKSDRGGAYFVGTIVREDAFYDALTRHVLKTAGVRPPFEVPEGVEVCVRSGKGRKLYFFVNHTPSAKEVVLPAKWKARALLGAGPEGSILSIPGGDVTVLKTV